MDRFNRNIVFRILATAFVVIFGVVPIRAQSDPQMTQYWAIPTLYNPAETGATDYLRIRGGAKLQWVGIENAPQSFLAIADSPLQIAGKRVGVGANFVHESLGLFRNLQVNLQASYKFRALKGQFSIGIEGGYFSSKFKGSKVYIPEGDDYHQPDDPALPTYDLAGSAFDFSAGLSYTHKYFSIGVSGLHLLQPTVDLVRDGSKNQETDEFETELCRMLYFVASGNIPIKNSLFTLQPSVLVKSDLTSVLPEVTLRGTYNRFISAGVGYRLNEAISVMIGAEIKNFFLGYAFDYPLSKINRASSGSHELVAGFSLKLDFSKKNTNAHRSIRLM